MLYLDNGSRYNHETLGIFKLIELQNINGEGSHMNFVFSEID